MPILETGKVVIPVSALIDGYQKSLEEMRRQLQRVGADSKIGKQIGTEIDAVSKKLTALSQQEFVTVKTQAQFNSLKKTIDEIGSRMLKIGTDFGNLSFKDLDLEHLSSEFTSLVQRLETIRQTLETPLKFSDMFADIHVGAESFEQIMERFKIDPSKLNFDTWSSSFKSAIDSQVAEADRLKQELSQVKQQLADIEKLQTSFGRLAADESTLRATLFSGAGGATKGVHEAVVQKSNLTSLHDTLEQGIAQIDDKQIKGVLQERLNTIFSNIKPGDAAQGLAKKIFQELSHRIEEEGKQSAIGVDAIRDALQKGITRSGSSFQFGDLYKKGVSKDAVLSGLDSSVIERLGANIDALYKKTGNLGLVGQAFEQLKKDIESSIGKGDTAAVLKRITDAVIAAQKVLRDNAANLNARQANMLTDKNTADINVATLQAASNQLKQNVDASLKTRQDLQNEANRISVEIENKGTQHIQNLAATFSSDTTSNIDAATAALKRHNQTLEQTGKTATFINKLQGLMQRYFSIYAIIRQVTRAINEMKKTIQALDKTMTEIAIVTNMTQDQLWNQVDAYTEMANKYAASISGAYEVSQLYYQQGMSNI